MKTFTTMRSWIAEEESRLGARTYAGGGFAIRSKITQGAKKWQRLDGLARVFRGPLHKRVYVRELMRGIPYLTASDVGRADLPRDVHLSRLLSPELPVLRIESDWLLVSSAGTIGQVTYVRDELTEFAISQDMLRVAPKGAAAPGYLFAFLSSRQGQALLRMRTYGSIVDRIEPQHIADLPVPIPDDSFQERIQNLITSAAVARTEASRLLDGASGYFDSLAGPMPSSHDHAYAVGMTRPSQLGYRLDAFYSIGWAAEPSFGPGERIDSLAKVIFTNRVPRIYVQQGVPFLSGIDVFRFRPSMRVRLAAYVVDAFDARVSAGDIAIQGSGQRYGLIGRPAYIGRYMDGWAASHDLFRIRGRSSQATSRIYAFLRSESGHRVMLRHSYGTSIPHVNPSGIAAVRVPALPEALNDAASRALTLREQADADESQAIQEVEAWVG